MTTDESKDELTQFEHALRNVLASGDVTSYGEKRDKCIRINRIVREEIGRTLEPLINEELRKMPQESYLQKQKLAHWINNELRPFGLAALHPNQKVPSVVEANRGNGGRFRFSYRDNQGRLHTSGGPRTLSFVEVTAAENAAHPLGRKGRIER